MSAEMVDLRTGIPQAQREREMHRPYPSGLLPANNVSLRLSCLPGQFVTTAIAGSIHLGLSMKTAPGVISLTGNNANVFVGRMLITAPGAFLEAGIGISIHVGLSLKAAKGVLVVAGMPAVLTPLYHGVVPFDYRPGESPTTDTRPAQAVTADTRPQQTSAIDTRPIMPDFCR